MSLIVSRNLGLEGLEPREMLRHHGWFHKAIHAVEHLVKDVVKVTAPEIAIVKNLADGQGPRKSVENAFHDVVHAEERLLPVAIAVVGTAVGQPELGAIGADAVRRLESGEGPRKSLENTFHDVVGSVKGNLINAAVSAAANAILPEIANAIPIGNGTTISSSAAADFSKTVDIANKVQANFQIIDAAFKQYGDKASLINDATARTVSPNANSISDLTKKLAALEKYQPSDGKTYCNFFVQDVASGFNGSSIPELNGTANQIAGNLRNSNEWSPIGTADSQYALVQSQQLANNGKLVVASWANPDGHGHIALIVPARTGDPNLLPSGWTVLGVDGKSTTFLNVPHVAQAGDKVFDYGKLSDSFSNAKKSDVTLYVYGTIPGISI